MFQWERYKPLKAKIHAFKSMFVFRGLTSSPSACEAEAVVMSYQVDKPGTFLKIFVLRQ